MSDAYMCLHCKAPRRFTQRINHVLHLLLTCLTLGLWLPIWLGAIVFAPPRCEVCGCS
jgi:hypothetical protein